MLKSAIWLDVLAKRMSGDIYAVLLWHQNGVRRCLACASSLGRSHDLGWVVSRRNRAKTALQYLLCGATRREAKQASNCHALVEIRQDWRTPVVRLSGEPPCDPNQSSALPVIDYNRLTPGEAKETHP